MLSFRIVIHIRLANCGGRLSKQVIQPRLERCAIRRGKSIAQIVLKIARPLIIPRDMSTLVCNRIADEVSPVIECVRRHAGIGGEHGERHGHRQSQSPAFNLATARRWLNKPLSRERPIRSGVVSTAWVIGIRKRTRHKRLAQIVLGPTGYGIRDYE